jgi:hypothetical protein
MFNLYFWFRFSGVTLISTVPWNTSLESQLSLNFSALNRWLVLLEACVCALKSTGAQMVRSCTASIISLCLEENNEKCLVFFFNYWFACDVIAAILVDLVRWFLLLCQTTWPQRLFLFYFYEWLQTNNATHLSSRCWQWQYSPFALRSNIFLTFNTLL